MGRRIEWRGVVDDGVVRLSERAPEWLDDDQDKALAFVAREADRCPNCGTFPGEWFDSDRIVEPYEWESGRCYGCVTKDEKRRSVDADDAVGVFVRIKRRLFQRKAPPNAD